MKKFLLWFFFLVISFAFASCVKKDSSGFNVGGPSRTVPVVSYGPIAFNTGDSIELISATPTANSNEYKFIFGRNGDDSQKNLVLVPIQVKEASCIPCDASKGGNGAFLGTLNDGTNLWVYAFQGDESTPYAPAGNIYFRVSVGTQIVGDGDFMMYSVDRPGNIFVSGTIANGANKFGIGRFHIDDDSVIIK
jgi:hypothetical protein